MRCWFAREATCRVTVAWLLVLALACSADAASNATSSQPSGTSLLPDLIVTNSAITYSLNKGCSAGGVALTFHITVRNMGPGDSPPVSELQGGVLAQTNLPPGAVVSTWAGAASLPAIPSKGSTTVVVDVKALGSAKAMAGSHVFDILINNNGAVKELSHNYNRAQVAVAVPVGFCQNANAPKAEAERALSPTPRGSYSVTESTSVPMPASSSQSAGTAVTQKRTQESFLRPVVGGYSYIEFTIVTGSDDLRGDSEAYASFPTIPFSKDMACVGCPPDSNYSCWLKMSTGDSWDNGSRKGPVPCALPKAMTLTQLQQTRIDIHLLSRSRSWETPDNWNIEQITIGAYNPGSNVEPACFFNASGDPLVRLKQSNPDVEITIYPSQC